MTSDEGYLSYMCVMLLYTSSVKVLYYVSNQANVVGLTLHLSSNAEDVTKHIHSGEFRRIAYYGEMSVIRFRLSQSNALATRHGQDVQCQI
jgi:hypothetical protein